VPDVATTLLRPVGREDVLRITVTVPKKPARAGIDPRNLLIDVEVDDNFEMMTHADAVSSPR
jgi:hypothetical protein